MQPVEASTAPLHIAGTTSSAESGDPAVDRPFWWRQQNGLLPWETKQAAQISLAACFVDWCDGEDASALF